MFDMPLFCKTALEILESNGFEAYVVGGSVRDNFLKRNPTDFDIATNALPNEIKECFSGFKIIDTGIKHGTISVIVSGNTIEITTYRTDGKYKDNRHPSEVLFLQNLSEDLKRRDFTINAMAMDKEGRIVDLFGGIEDLNSGKLVTVGNPYKRFSEDALRILRGLRFSSVLGFEIEKETSNAIHEYKELLKNISAERIRTEFKKLLMGENCMRVLREYRDVISVFIPEIKCMFDFKQYSPYHKYDVWEHTIHSIQSAVSDEIVKISMLFHDIGKPYCFTMDKNGRGHFKGHALKSAEIAEKIMKRLRFSKNEIFKVTLLIEHHSDNFCSKKEIKKLLREIGEENYFTLLNVQRADTLAKQEFCRERLSLTDNQEALARKIIENNECFLLSQLAVNGNNIKKLGYENQEIGKTLNEILELVIDGKLENSKNTIEYYLIHQKNTV